MLCCAVALHEEWPHCSHSQIVGNQIYRKAARERSQALQAALQDYGYDVTTLPIIMGVSGSHYHPTTHALKQIGIEHTQQTRYCSTYMNMLSLAYI